MDTWLDITIRPAPASGGWTVRLVENHWDRRTGRVRADLVALDYADDHQVEDVVAWHLARIRDLRNLSGNTGVS